MARVDPDDDTIDRIVAFHYRYDPERRERRWIPMAAFDNEPEFLSYIHEAHRELTARKADGIADPKELLKGESREPDSTRRARRARLEWEIVRRTKNWPAAMARLDAWLGD